MFFWRRKGWSGFLRVSGFAAVLALVGAACAPSSDGSLAPQAHLQSNGDLTLTSVRYRVPPNGKAQSFTLDTARGLFVPHAEHQAGELVQIYQQWRTSTDTYGISELTPLTLISLSSLMPEDGTGENRVLHPATTRACNTYAPDKAKRLSYATKLSAGTPIHVLDDGVDYKVGYHSNSIFLTSAPCTIPGSITGFNIGWEVETHRHDKVVNFFRPLDLPSDATWFGLPESQRAGVLIQAISAASGLLHADPIPADWYILPWTKVAPEFLAADAAVYASRLDNTLTIEPTSTVVELKSLPVAYDPVALRDQMDLARKHGIEGNYHFHFTFPIEQLRHYSQVHSVDAAKLYATYYVLVNEWLYLAALEEHDAGGFGIPALETIVSVAFRPASERDRVKMLDALRNYQIGSHSDVEDLSLEYRKHKELAFRIPADYQSDRFGFELRSPGDDLELQLKILQQMRQILAEPRRSLVDGQGMTHSLESLTHITTLAEQDFAGFDPRVQKALLELSSYLTQREPYLSNDTYLVWSLPLVAWESRPFIDPSLHQEITDARQAYRSSVEGTMIGLIEGESYGPDDAEWLPEYISEQLIAWAKRVRLAYEYRDMFAREQR